MSLVDDIRSGDSAAIKQLYQENAQDVYEFAKGITNNHDSAMQATKNTLSKLVQQIQSGEEPANLHSEALKLAYDEACKIAMPSVQNIKSPYDEDDEEPAPAPVPTPRKRREEAPARPNRDEYSYEEEEPYEEEEAPRVQQRRTAPRGNRQSYESRQQPPRRSSREDYYEEDYGRRYDRYEDEYEDEYDDYDMKPRHGAGFWICLIINIILLLLLIWFLIGLLMNLGVIEGSTADNLFRILQYGWFNETIYPLF